MSQLIVSGVTQYLYNYSSPRDWKKLSNWLHREDKTDLVLFHLRNRSLCHKKQIKLGESGTVCKSLTDAKDVRHLSIAAACSRLTGKRWVVLYSLRAVHQLLLLAKIRVVFVSGLPRGGKGGLPGNWIAACVCSPTPVRFSERERFDTSVETSAGKAGTVKEQNLF